MQMRTGADRLRHTLGFEGLGLMISIPLFSLLAGQPADHLGPLAIGLSLLATGWNYLYNLLVDHWMVRQLGRLEKRFLERVLQALLFELGLLLVALPLTALWLDIGFSLFFVLYAFGYNLAYDHLFQTAFTKHPYRYTTIGTEEEIKGFKKEDAEYFYRK